MWKRQRDSEWEKKRDRKRNGEGGVDKEQTTPTLPFSQDLAVNELIFHPASAVNDWHFPHAERGPLKSGPSDRDPFIFTWREHRATGHNAMPRHAARRTLTCVWTWTQRGTTGTVGQERCGRTGRDAIAECSCTKTRGSLSRRQPLPVLSRKNQSFILL